MAEKKSSKSSCLLQYYVRLMELIRAAVALGHEVNAAGKKCARTITAPWAPQTCTVWKTISSTSVATIHSGLCQRDVLHVGYEVRPSQLGCVQQFPILYKCCNRRLISGLIKVRLLLLDSIEGLFHFWHLCTLSSVYILQSFAHVHFSSYFSNLF